MEIKIRVPREVVDKILPTYADVVAREGWSDEEIIRAKAETLLRFYAEGKLVFADGSK